MENVVCESRHGKTTLANPIAEEEVQDAWALLTLSQVSGNGSNRAHLCSAFEFGRSTEHPYLPALVMIISVPISWNLFQRSAHCNSTWISSMVDMAAGTGPVAPDARSVWVLKEQEVRSVSTSESDPVLCSESATWTIKAKVRNYPVALMPGCKKKGGGGWETWWAWEKSEQKETWSWEAPEPSTHGILLFILWFVFVIYDLPSGFMFPTWHLAF